MSEPQSVKAERVENHQADGVQTAGKALRCAREAAGVSLDVLASQLKVPVAKLNALEADQLSGLLDIVFARSLACSVARTLGVDQALILGLSPFKDHGVYSERAIKNKIEDETIKLKPIVITEKKSKKFLIFASICIIVLIIVIFNSFLVSRYSAAAANVSLTEDSALVTSPEKSIRLSSAFVADQSNLNQVGDVQQRADSPPNDLTNAVSAQHTALLLKARGSTWVQVRNKNKTIIFERQLRADENIEMNDGLPLSVVVGRADVTDVWLRGQNFRLDSVSRDNVARFEVNE